MSQLEPIRIAYLLADPGVPYHDSRKGSSIHARSMVRAFMREGCDVDVLALRRGKDALTDFPVSEVPRGGFSKILQRCMPSMNWFEAARWLLRQREFLNAARRKWPELPPHFVYARHAWLAYPYTRLRRELGVPLALEVNAVFSIEKEARGEIAMRRRTRRVEREIFAAADLILPVSASIRMRIEAFGIDPARILVMPNAVDLELFWARTPPPAAQGWGDTFMIGSVSSFRAYHGTATLLRAAALLKGEIPGLRVRLIGAGPEFESIRALAGELGLQDGVEFHGVVDHGAVPDLLRECDVCAAPYEGEHNQYNCPMKLFEYMALETPIVASAWGDIPNIVRDGETAVLHRPGDAQDLRRAVLAIYCDPVAARRRAVAARKLAEAHTWRHAAREILTRMLKS